VSGRNNNDSRASIIKVNFATAVVGFDFTDLSEPRFGCKFEIESSGNVHFYTRRLNDNTEFNYFKLSQNGSLLIQRQSSTSESTPPPIDLLITNNQLYFTIDQETNFFGEAQINSYNTTASTNNNAHNIRLNINGEFQSVRSLKSLSNIHGFYLKSYNSQLYKMFIAYGPFYNNGNQYDKGSYDVK
jgi:hypothetical protein